MAMGSRFHVSSRVQRLIPGAVARYIRSLDAFDVVFAQRDSEWRGPARRLRRTYEDHSVSRDTIPARTCAPTAISTAMAGMICW